MFQPLVVGILLVFATASLGWNTLRSNWKAIFGFLTTLILAYASIMLLLGGQLDSEFFLLMVLAMGAHISGAVAKEFLPKAMVANWNIYVKFTGIVALVSLATLVILTRS